MTVMMNYRAHYLRYDIKVFITLIYLFYFIYVYIVITGV